MTEQPSVESTYDAVVVGGGFFGAVVALHLSKTRGRTVALVERGPELLGRASYSNQARVHGGYHYPRSFTTAARSRLNYPRFVEEYADCIDTTFTKYYAIARRFSNVSGRQFKEFCARIDAPVRPAPSHVRDLFDRQLIEEVVEVEECALDAVKLRKRLLLALQEAGVEIRLQTEALRVEPDGSRLGLDCVSESVDFRLVTQALYNCTYSRLNKLLHDSGLPLVPLKHELAEMALVEPPPELEKMGLTVMCGPFFSIMPFPARGLHSLSHVRYTPHAAWHTDEARYRDPYAIFEASPRVSDHVSMIKDAQRYLPVLRECRYMDSLWEVKTVLPRSEVDDSRPILLSPHHGLPNLHCVTGAKLDNIYDVLTLL